MATMPLAGARAQSPAAAERYDEYYAYSSAVRRSYQPGFIPKNTSLFMNPRVFPSAVGRLGDTYLYASRPGWHLGSPMGYTTGTNPESPALAYLQGRQGITQVLRYGHPDGKRVIEPILVPSGATGERGGIFIGNPGAPGSSLDAEPMGPSGVGRLGMPVPVPSEYVPPSDK